MSAFDGGVRKTLRGLPRNEFDGQDSALGHIFPFEVIDEKVDRALGHIGPIRTYRSENLRRLDGSFNPVESHDCKLRRN